MFLPIGDTPNPRSTPYATWLLIGLNVAVFLLVTLPLSGSRVDLNDPLLLDYLHSIGARGSIPVEAILQQVSAYDLTVFRFGYRPAAPSLLSMFSAMFLHAGWMHLLGNMLFLWIFGDNVEHRLGPVRFLLAYLATGVAATLFFAFFEPGSQVPMIGASGAISGVLGLYFIWFPRNKVKVFIFFIIIIQVVEIPARLVLGFYLLVDNLLPFLFAGAGGGGVAHGAHIGGFVGGLALAWGIDRLLPAWKGRRLRGREPGPADTGDRGETVAEEIRRLLAEGHPGRAVSRYLSLETREQRRQVDGDQVLAIGDFLLAGGAHDEALSVFRRFIADRGNDSRLSRAYLGAGRALMHKPRCMTSAYHYFLGALDVAEDPSDIEAARRYIAAIQNPDKR
ncbi:hypothetical protein C2E25_10560 [Geothermobacter hydrogeniphilus]|uniref:Peptidase S54 rhomboid domain-containing protein n=1 Tax=Geothermobacter hydrogeniphilus TaxID=1969733 RepID=A0A2K2H981_9BACT|nr:rhomboid family intramembrane serine protease [Geothermobacter hydrogeniphilus]PNU19864.1 hypothetical protein C2E25_10560 [Geothermobacter hydrogeniphilus]